jgi:uncharacterized repeat protein (TIGR03803 family)
MSSSPKSAAFLSAGTLLAATLLAPGLACAQTQTALYNFAPNASDEYLKGAGPQDELIEAPNGDFFTTTQQGGDSSSCPTSSFPHGCGTVVQLRGATVRVIASFPAPAAGGVDGYSPVGGLVQGPDSALYGTTTGGPAPNGFGSGFGTVFKLVEQPNGSWLQTTLHVFTGGNECVAPIDGALPVGRLAFGPDGLLYGTTQNGGCVLESGDSPYNNQGTIFRLATDGTAYQVLWLFNGYFDTADGAVPQAGLTFGPGGLFYGTTHYGGLADTGTVFKFDPVGLGLTVMHSFSGLSPDGGVPLGVLTLGSDGLLWSTTFAGTNGGDPSFYGTVFKISPTSPYAMTSYLFAGLDNENYGMPKAGVIQASDGNYYGTTSSGSFYSITQSGVFSELGVYPTTLATTSPIAIPLQGSSGDIYTTTSDGGPTSFGNSDIGGIYSYSASLAKPKAVVKWFLPTNAPVGASVVIAGANFVNTSKVIFKGTTTSATFTVNASGFITAVVPAGAVTGPIKITTPAGRITSSVIFTVP